MVRQVTWMLSIVNMKDIEMSFVRQNTGSWHRDVPGARWFKADLHIHTIDDLEGKRAVVPKGITADLASDDAQAAYARRFLQSAVDNDVRILGITPHSPRLMKNPDVSAVWRIVEEWNQGIDDDGKPFREKIYAVFPGFEPALKQGSRGLHLIFLFDPEIGSELYFRLFDQIMGHVDPWRDNSLQVANLSASDAFATLNEFELSQNDLSKPEVARWSHLTLAPHIDGDKGLLKEQKAQILERFEHGQVAGLELGDEKLPEDTTKNRDWLRQGMDQYHQAFYHSSDAYAIEDIGKRHVWVKLASPRIAALRQAFIANESRIRIGFEKKESGELTGIGTPPDVTASDRRWLKSVQISEGASFFRSEKGDEPAVRFDFSPDLTCIIGGSMTGKSTLLDGLRVHVGAKLPHDERLRTQVESRASERFAAGSPRVELETPGQDPTAPVDERWPAEFHAQNELQRLAQEPDAIENILSGLANADIEGIAEREVTMGEFDRELTGLADRIAEIEDELGEIEQSRARSFLARQQLNAFAEAGVEELNALTAELNQWRETADNVKQLSNDLDKIAVSLQEDLFEIKESAVGDRLETGVVQQGGKFWRMLSEIATSLKRARSLFVETISANEIIIEDVTKRQNEKRVDVHRSLAERGYDGTKIKELQSLNSQASFLSIYDGNLAAVRSRLESLERSFGTMLEDRERTVATQREAFDVVMAALGQQFEQRIKAVRIDHGRCEPLGRWIKELGQRGITRWWNEHGNVRGYSPRQMVETLDSGDHQKIGMTDAVGKTFGDIMNKTLRRRLLALRCPDKYVIEMQLDDGNTRRIDDLSGGQRVSLLLSMALEVAVDRPLVIDQPEDELDNRFVYETVLPALKRLKGRRQIILATHSANFVVNGDADQVILLEASDDRSRVAISGAIEDPDVRDAIIRTVDGGDEAFKLRQIKYGF